VFSKPLEQIEQNFLKTTQIMSNNSEEIRKRARVERMKISREKEESKLPFGLKTLKDGIN